MGKKSELRQEKEREPGLFKRISDANRRFVSVARLTVALTLNGTNMKSAAKHPGSEQLRTREIWTFEQDLYIVD